MNIISSSPSTIARGLRGRCPRCGEGKLFQGFLTLRPACERCGLDYGFADAGDGPAVFVILGLGAIVMMLVFWVEFRFDPPWWLHLLIWPPLTFAGAAWMLRVLKGWLIVQQYRHRSTELEE